MPDGKKIVIVDDNPTLAQTLDMNLEIMGFQTTVVNDGLEGLETIKREKPALALVDLNLPGMSGFDICKNIKKNPETRDIRIIILSGTVQDTNEFLNSDVGADDYIVKPYDLEKLIDKIEKLTADQ